MQSKGSPRTGLPKSRKERPEEEKMLEGDERARQTVERFYRTEKEPMDEVLWATATKAYVFAVAKRAEKRSGRTVPVHYAVRITWRVLLAYDEPKAGVDPREDDGGTMDGALGRLRNLFQEAY